MRLTWPPAITIISSSSSRAATIRTLSWRRTFYLHWPPRHPRLGTCLGVWCRRRPPVSRHCTQPRTWVAEASCLLPAHHFGLATVAPPRRHRRSSRSRRSRRSSPSRHSSKTCRPWAVGVLPELGSRARQQSSTIYCCAMVQHVKTQLATAKSTEVSSAELQVDYLILNLKLAG